MRDSCTPSESRYSSESKYSEFLLIRVRLQNASYRLYGFFIRVQLEPSRVDTVEGRGLESLSVGCCEVNGHRHVDEPPAAQVLDEGGFFIDVELCKLDILLSESLALIVQVKSLVALADDVS